MHKLAARPILDFGISTFIEGKRRFPVKLPSENGSTSISELNEARDSSKYRTSPAESAIKL
jgi:hypothetical protein